MIETCTRHTYGFSTILAPLYFIFKFFHLQPPDFESYYEWEWNPAQYFSSYAFQDFGYFYFVLFYFIGIILYVIDSKALKQKNIRIIAIYFVVLYGIISFVVFCNTRDRFLVLITPSYFAVESIYHVASTLS